MKINFNKKYTIKYLMSELIWLRKESDYRVILDRLTSSDDEIIILTIGVLKSRGYYILSELLITFSNKKILADEELYNYRAFNHMLSNRESMLLFHVFLSECYKYNIIKGGIYSKDGYKNSIEKKIYNNYLEYIYNNSDIKKYEKRIKRRAKQIC